MEYYCSPFCRCHNLNIYNKKNLKYPFHNPRFSCTTGPGPRSCRAKLMSMFIFLRVSIRCLLTSFPSLLRSSKVSLLRACIICTTGPSRNVCAEKDRLFIPSGELEFTISAMLFIFATSVCQEYLNGSLFFSEKQGSTIRYSTIKYCCL